jgi:hypothetical protein
MTPEGGLCDRRLPPTAMGFGWMGISRVMILRRSNDGRLAAMAMGFGWGRFEGDGSATFE